MKKIVKKIIRAVAVSVVWPLSYAVRWTKSEVVFVTFAELLSLVPSKIGSYLRLAFYRLTLTKGAKEAYIGFGSYFSHTEVEVGEGVYIGGYCIIGKVKIGDDCTIGSGVYILSGKRQHEFKSLSQSIQKQGGVFEQIEIGENCWIGNCAVIMSDIGENVIIGAGSVVVEKILPYSIAVGNPARVIKKRFH